mgnify:CR=1 FL=1
MDFFHFLMPKEQDLKKFVFYYQKENEKDFKEVIGNRMADVMDVEYVFQDLTNLPEGFEVPDGRNKTMGNRTCRSQLY